MLRGSLNAVHNFLRVGAQVQARDGLPHNPYRNLLQQADGVVRLSQLTHHADENIRTLSVEAMEAMMIEEDTDVGSEGTDTTKTSDGEDGSE
ncbi:unnamed protein product [Vitrella brassicaformis CCMP3155]|uniref:Uncharacterized protein n=1 Tax=Vitrella brassicaformis (strain CCMP3155) TaxID=1169540 RepID=A0A0G4GHG0_VITBC|nr:unnamed protein product [Vitrella brassicaformis CCMP3155]|eukprot:CEM29161.1 unnamed protein product [Vitrella brassicaformis CCMP3155]